MREEILCRPADGSLVSEEGLFLVEQPPSQGHIPLNDTPETPG